MKRTTIAALGATMFLGVSSLESQIRASERGASIQTIDGTTVTIDYGRPQVRGRTNLYGGEIPWGKKWTPGANWATTIEVNNPITINGHALDRGKYSIWFEVKQSNWQVIIDPEHRRFHLSGPSNDPGSVTFAVTPETIDHTEILTWDFTRITPTGATLRFAWADRGVDFAIAVEPSMPLTVANEMAETFVGTYQMTMEPAAGGGQSTIELSYVDGHLVADWPGFPNPHLHHNWWIYRGAGMFSPAMLQNDQLFDIVTDVIFEFPSEDDPSTLEVRGPGDVLLGTGRRST